MRKYLLISIVCLLPLFSAAAQENRVPAEGGTGSSAVPGLFNQEVLFKPLLADPRNASFSTGMRFGDNAFDGYAYDSAGNWTGAVGTNRIFWTFSFGDRIGIYQWDRVFGGRLKISLEGAAWSVFALRFVRDADEYFSSMMNIDFRVGIPLTWSNGTLSWKLSVYHQSSHLGDELMNALELSGDPSGRVNPSNEALDLAVSWLIIPQVRVYLLFGVYISSDETYSVPPVFFEWGGEFRPFIGLSGGKAFTWEPYAAIHLRNRQENSFFFDGTYTLGVELIPNNPAVKYRFRFSGEYHHGYSFDGQFSRDATDYFGFSFGAGF